jgi:hypothetical protein
VCVHHAHVAIFTHRYKRQIAGLSDAPLRDGNSSVVCDMAACGKTGFESVMKAGLALLLLPSLVLSAPAEVDDTDIRVVNGMSVDLAPLHQWYRNPEGERPLKHWVKLTVLEVKPPLAGAYTPCVVQSPAGRHEVLFRKLPPETQRTIAAINSLQRRVDSLRQEITREEAWVRRDEAVYEGTVVRSSGYIVGSNFVHRYYRQRPSNAAIDTRLDRVALTEKQELAATLEAELNALRQDTNAVTIFVLDTRKTYGGLPVWETGK